MIVNITQRTEEWHEWREGCIGASDAPVIMGVSKWMTPYELWLKKKYGLHSEDNAAMARGRIMEEQARHAYMHSSKVPVSPACYEHDRYPFIIASLDGITFDGSVVVEIKCPGKQDHECAINGKVPDHYYPQLQHQLMVTGAERVDYYSFDGESGVTIPVYPDLEYQQELLWREIFFFDSLCLDVEPPSEDPRYIVIDDPDFIERSYEYKDLKERYDLLGKQLEKKKQELLALTDDGDCIGGCVKCRRVSRAGSIDLVKLSKDTGIDLEKYRKPEIGYYKIDILKEASYEES